MSWSSWQRMRARMGHPPRRAVPTRPGLFALGAILVLGLAATNASNNLLLLLLGAMLGSIVLSGVLSERNIDGISVHVRALSSAHVGEPAALVVSFERSAAASARGPAYALAVRERQGSVFLSGLRRYGPDYPGLNVLVPVLSESMTSRLGRRTFERRGLARLGPCELTTRYPFGLIVKLKDVDVTDEVLVRPRRIPLPAVLADPQRAVGDAAMSARRGDGWDLYGLRERQPWDPARRVHALRSLSLGFDVVIETEGVERPVAWVGIANVEGTDPEAFERALEVLQAVLVGWDQEGYAVGLSTMSAVYPPFSTSIELLLDVVARLEMVDSVPLDRAPALWIVPEGAVFSGSAPAVARIDREGGIALERAPRSGIGAGEARA